MGQVRVSTKPPTAPWKVAEFLTPPLQWSALANLSQRRGVGGQLHELVLGRSRELCVTKYP